MNIIIERFSKDQNYALCELTSPYNTYMICISRNKLPPDSHEGMPLAFKQGVWRHHDLKINPQLNLHLLNTLFEKGMGGNSSSENKC